MGHPSERTFAARTCSGHRRTVVLAAVAALLAVPLASPAQEYSLRFYGHGVSDLDRVKIPIDAPPRPADVGTDFTLEWWMKANLADNDSDACTTGGDSWINGNIMFDRDVFNAGDFGDFGVSLYGGQLAFGLAVGSSGATVCSENSVANGAWHHVAVTRNSSSGVLRIFIDGQLQPEDIGPTGNASYRDGRSTSFPNDPFLVIGAEKHDAGSNFPSYNGLIDEVRISDSIRYTVDFTPPTSPFVTDGDTIALYHFNEGPEGLCVNNSTIVDDSGAAGGPSNGICKSGGSAPQGPVYVGDSPFGPAGPTPTPTATPTPLCGSMSLASNCRTPEKALLLVKDGDDSKEKVIWKWLRGQATSDLEFGDPVNGSTVYSLCVYDRTADILNLALSATVTAGTGWSASGSGPKYSDKTGAAGGITKIQLKPGGDGEAKILVKAKGGALQLPPPISASEFFDQDSSITVQLLSSDGPCWEATYSAAVKNEVDQFKGKTP